MNDRLKAAIQNVAERHAADTMSHGMKRGSHTWLYLDRVKKGYARKQAHMWHGPFRIAEV